MPRAFIVGAAIPNGGTYMAYQLGRILQQHFSFQAVGIRIGLEYWDHTKHHYPDQFTLISIGEMESQIAQDDILIVNPAFSHHMFGLRLPGRKVSYVQGFNTFAILDGRLDHYVAASEFVQNFLSNVYEISATVIPPYLEAADSVQPASWLSRPEGSVFVYLKGASSRAFFEHLRRLIGENVQFADVVEGISLPRSELLTRIAACRYFLSLSCAEGFGLVPLEAMALGTTVIGFDGFGGRQYFRSMKNCAVATYPNIEAIHVYLRELTANTELAMTLANEGRETARQYTYERFRDSWISYFASVIQPSLRS